MVSATISAPLLLVLFLGAWRAANAETCAEKHGPSEGSHGYIYSTMIRAVRQQDLYCVKELLEEGFNPDETDSYTTPLLVAAEKGYVDIAKVLLKYGATPNDLTYRNESPIFEAVCYGKTEIVKVLMDAGISTDIVDFDGKKPSEAACACREAPANCPKSEIQRLMDKPNIKVNFNHDYPSNDGILNDGTKAITANNRECNDLCANTSGCSVWTRIKRTVGGGSKEGECWLRSYQPASVARDHCDSGVMSCAVSDKTEYTSSDDLLSNRVNGKSEDAQDCCGLCYGTSDCKSWTWIKWDTKYNKKGDCWLRSGYPNGHARDGAASGHINHRAS